MVYCSTNAIKHQIPLVLVSLVLMFLNADQSVLPVNMSAIAKEYGFDDIQRDEKLGGLVTGAFFASSAVSSLLSGRMADVISRMRLLMILGVMGGCGSLFCSVAASFWQLLLFRTLVGAAVGGVVPVVFAVIGDLYVAEERPQCIMVSSIIAGIGPGLGQFLAAYFGSMAWQLPFAVIGIASLVFALVLPGVVTAVMAKGDRTRPSSPTHSEVQLKNMSRTEEGVAVPDGGKEAEKEMATGKRNVPKSPTNESGMLPIEESVAMADDDKETKKEVVADKFQLMMALRPSAVLVCMQGFFGCVPWAVINTFLTDYFAMDGKMGVPYATALLAIFGIGCAVGTIAGAPIGQYLYRLDIRFLPLAMCVTCASGAGLLIILLALPGSALQDVHWIVYYVVSFFAGTMSCFSGNNAKAILMNTTASHVRGTAFGILRFMDDMGKTLGPIIISKLVLPFGRKVAFIVGISCWLPCALFCGLLCKTVPADERSAKSRDGHAV